MAAPVGAFVMRDAVVTIESVEYANQCTKARLVPDTPVQTVRTLVPDGVIQDIDTPTWTLELTFLQINAAGGLAKALRDAPAGDQLDVILAPKNATGNTKATFTVIAMQSPFGGEQGSFATTELTLPVLGAPVFGTL
jgi:hypothetical protein